MANRETELLNISEAAQLLKVSTASLRRWTNAGHLTCLRIGGRRERRFRRTDLLAFLEASNARGATVAAASADPADYSGHLCGLYTGEVGRTRQAVDFLVEGLTAGSNCFLAAAKDVQSRVRSLLRRRRPGLPRDIADGRLLFLDLADYSALQLDSWQTEIEAALRAGARSLHVVGDHSSARSARRRTFAERLQYEAEYERRIARRFPVTSLCLYDARILSGVEATQVLRAHRDNFRYPVESLVT